MSQLAVTSVESFSRLNQFFGKASLATYAGVGKYVQPWNKGFNELEYVDGAWSYRDSFVGFFKSFGREVVWYEEKPIWTQQYSGGMQDEYVQNEEFTKSTFHFLKKALSAGEKIQNFQPRGPREYTEQGWLYRTGFIGNLCKFIGNEEILFNNKLVFTHHYFGGLVVNKE